jgi:hypothetical protein
LKSASAGRFHAFDQQAPSMMLNLYGSKLLSLVLDDVLSVLLGYPRMFHDESYGVWRTGVWRVKISISNCSALRNPCDVYSMFDV